MRERRLPVSLIGPVLFRALRRLASICLSEVMSAPVNWLRFAIFAAVWWRRDMVLNRGRWSRLAAVAPGFGGFSSGRSGCVSVQSARAAPVASIPALLHHEASSPDRWTSR